MEAVKPSIAERSFWRLFSGRKTVRLREQQSDVRISPEQVHEQSAGNFAERENGGGQLGVAGGHHRPGLRRLHRHLFLQRNWRAGGLHPRRLRVPKAENRSSRCRPRPRAARFRVLCRSSIRGPTSLLHAVRSTTLSRSSVWLICTAGPFANAPKRSSEFPIQISAMSCTPIVRTRVGCNGRRSRKGEP